MSDSGQHNRNGWQLILLKSMPHAKVYLSELSSGEANTQIMRRNSLSALCLVHKILCTIHYQFCLVAAQA